MYYKPLVTINTEHSNLTTPTHTQTQVKEYR